MEKTDPEMIYPRLYKTDFIYYKQRKLINSIFLWILLSIFSTLHATSDHAFAADREIRYDARGKRDPFVSPLAKTAGIVISGLHGVRGIEDINIQGFVYDPRTGSYIIANGVVLMEGETQGDVTAVEITQSGVRFLIHNRVEFKNFDENGG